MVKPAMVTSSANNQYQVNNFPTNNPNSSHEIKYKGVRKRKWGKWVSEIRLPNCRDRIWLGSYDSPEKAARAFDAALYCLRGRHANFNFPDTPFEVSIGAADQSLTSQEIQVVAARFANEHEEDDNVNEDEREEEDQPNIDKEESSEHVCGDTFKSNDDTMVKQTGSFYNGSDGDMDWSFLNTLDNSDVVTSDLGLYSELDKMHSGELFYPTSPQPFHDNIEDNGDIGALDDDNACSHQSFLWNF
ncbi:hypothetical protein L6164_024424 [Bauhinia variegata]|uniref:Uncharacterized protein n=1 Tax=Bauhinia variegata TaxID=167791 RepID=A0ACB9LXQ9_BAUVA|nr:hypothetical protein L6164_024424 [Bauhinia variegata]